MRKLKLLFLFIVLLGITECCQAQVAPRTGWDIHVLYQIKKTRTPLQTAFFRTISDINNPVCLAVPATLLILSWIKRRQVLRSHGLQVALSIALSESVTFSMKLIFGRLRPQLFDKAFIPIVYAINKSFPSGHTSESFCMATAISLLYPKWYVIVPAYTWAVLIAYSRMYLGVHFPTDIMGGMAVGFSAAWAAWAINRWLVRRKAARDKTDVAA